MNLTVKNGAFAYQKDCPIFKDISFCVDAGEILAILGPNGAGKTTLLKLLTRLYDPTEGRILLDGVDIREFEPRDLYNMFGIIFQDFGKYAESVSDNVRFGNIRVSTDEAKIDESLKMANAKEPPV